MKNSFLEFLNAPIKKTWWYKSNYGDVVKMKNWNIFNLDLATLGSSAVRFGLDYSSFDINAANWAMTPQNTASSFAILKNYHSFIKDNGIAILLLICPFQGFVLDYNKEYYDSYHYFMQPNLVRYFDERTQKKIIKIIDYPLQGSARNSVKAIIKKIFGKDKPRYTNAKIDAQNRINSWKKQFSIVNFTDRLSGQNLEKIGFNTNLICEIADFCLKHSLKPVLGIMPVNKTLKDQIPSEFIQKAFYDMVEKIKERTGIQFLDYYRSHEFESEDLYLDSFLMNEKGRKYFTNRVLKDLGLTAEEISK